MYMTRVMPGIGIQTIPLRVIFLNRNDTFSRINHRHQLENIRSDRITSQLQIRIVSRMFEDLSQRA